MTKSCTWTSAFAAALLVVSAVPAARAQDQPVVYTRVAQWQIARTSWDGYEKDVTKNFVPVMEKLLADGVITEFGADRNTVHSPDGYTHSTWFCSRTLAGLEKALETYVQAQGKLTPAERKLQDTDFAGSKHADLILRSVAYHNRPVKTNKGYETVSVQKVQPGKAQDYMALYDKYTKPVLEQLYQDGALTAYGVDAELVHTADTAYRYFWQVLPDADALDKVQAAFAAARAKRTPEERRAVGQAFADVSDASAHRDAQSNITVYNVK